MNVLNHPLIVTLKNLKGNARSVVFTEPLWGIPYFLYAPYVSIYMLSLGVKDNQIGLITSIGLVFQVVFALLSGAITDKLGRKRTTLIFDLLSWSVSCLIWAVAQNFTYFIFAVMINALWRVPSTSWSCLLVEDTPQDQLVHIYSWIYISGLLVAFFSPIAGIFIDKFSLVPTMRGLYIFAFVVMTAKFLILNRYASETTQGKIRMQETRGQPLFTLLGGYREVFIKILKTPKTLVALGIWLVMMITMMITSTFWAIIVTEKLHIPIQHIAIYPFAKSILQLLFYFVVIPRIGSLPFKKPMLVGFCGFMLSQLLLIIVPEKNYLLLLLSVLIDAGASTLVNPFIDPLIVRAVDAQERARIMAILAVIVLSLASPFGWIGGQLSQANRVLPFILNISMFALGGGLVLLSSRLLSPQEAVLPEKA